MHTLQNLGVVQTTKVNFRTTLVNLQLSPFEFVEFSGSTGSGDEEWTVCVQKLTIKVCMCKLKMCVSQYV